MSSIVVIGNGQMAVSCVQKVLASGTDVPLIISDPRRQLRMGSLAQFCEKNEIQYIETSSVNSLVILHQIEQCHPDLLLSINSFALIKETLLSIPRLASINFHNSYLPNYPGLNACSWALINGEQDHGVTWHLMDKGLDTGDILTRAKFPIQPNDTAFSLTMKTISYGVLSFAENFQKWLAGDLIAEKQIVGEDVSVGSDGVKFDGLLDVNWSYKKIDRWFRGLSYYPLPGNLPLPYFEIGGEKIYPRSIKKLDHPSSNLAIGQVVEASKHSMTIKISDAVIQLGQISKTSGGSQEDKEHQGGQTAA